MSENTITETTNGHDEAHTPSSEDLHKLELQRRTNRDAVSDLGLRPYGSRTPGLMDLIEAHNAYDESSDKANKESVAARKAFKKDNPDAPEDQQPALVDDRPIVKVAGRVVLARDNGKLVWLNLRDHSSEAFQIAVSKRDCDEQGFALAKVLDMGDIVIAEGPLTKTNTGEVTCWASSLRPGSKCLVPPPEKHAGLQDPETRARKRYIDMWANPETTRTLMLRSRIVSAIRRLLGERGFVEVETPMLQTQAGGAAARPFLTHLNALDIPLSLRIAPELYLKRLLVGGMPRVYEINRNFRNEGVDKRHNPEFTAIELYEAFGDVESVMDVTEAIVREASRVARAERGIEGTTLSYGDLEIDYEQPFLRVTYAELFEKALGFPMSDVEKARAEAQKRGYKTKNEKGVEFDDLWVVNELFEGVAEKLIDPARPTWVMKYPAALSPLTRPNEEDPSFADRSDLFIAGMEIGPHYTELNDPDVQEAKFREQLSGIDDEESTFRTFDEDFIEALKVGMPPAGGMGLGIDRLVMLMSGKETIREVIPFPFVRPKQS